jgi:hypothetical protein
MGIRQTLKFSNIKSAIPHVTHTAHPAAAAETKPSNRQQKLRPLSVPGAFPSFPAVKEPLPHQTTKSHKPRLFAQKSLRASGFLHSFPAQRLNWASKLGNYTPTVNGFFGNFP